jgi:hypothetical protein
MRLYTIILWIWTFISRTPHPLCWINPVQHPQVEGPRYAPGCKEHTKEIGWEELPYGHTMFFLTLMLEGDEKFSDCS